MQPHEPPTLTPKIYGHWVSALMGAAREAKGAASA